MDTKLLNHESDVLPWDRERMGMHIDLHAFGVDEDRISIAINVDLIGSSGDTLLNYEILPATGYSAHLSTANSGDTILCFLRKKGHVPAILALVEKLRGQVFHFAAKEDLALLPVGGKIGEAVIVATSPLARSHHIHIMSGRNGLKTPAKLQPRAKKNGVQIMFSTLFFYLASYWLAWTNLFPALPLWSTHGAVMAPIIAAATLILAGKYLMNVVNRA